MLRLQISFRKIVTKKFVILAGNLADIGRTHKCRLIFRNVLKSSFADNRRFCRNQREREKKGYFGGQKVLRHRTECLLWQIFDFENSVLYKTCRKTSPPPPPPNICNVYMRFRCFTEIGPFG